MNKRAKSFLEDETEFHLGAMPTEQSNIKTKNLSQTLQHNTAEGIKSLFEVDEDIVPVAKAIFNASTFCKFVDSLQRAIQNRKRIFFSGCGSTGRLCVLLEASWRKYWQKIRQSHSDILSVVGDLEDMVCSIMTGGDRALVRSVENFEDFQKFGRHQITEQGLSNGDVVVAITEGGETSSVIGTAWQGVETGADVFFVYNNPTEVLRKHVKRSREVIEDDRITKIDLCSGPMAVSGSTRMQATTSELLVVGAALELALSGYLRSQLTPEQLREINVSNLAAANYADRFEVLLKELCMEHNLKTLAKLAEHEESIYREDGRVTYFADEFLLDIFTDTTERSPTFTLPPFRKCDDHVSPVSWVFVKNPRLNTPDSWRSVYHRKPNGLEWNSKTYEMLDAPEGIVKKTPALGNTDIYKFLIGNEDDPSRYDGCVSSALLLVAGTNQLKLAKEMSDLCSYAKSHIGHYDTASTICIGANRETKDESDYSICCELSQSPLELWTHLAIKLVLNTISSATMARMNRVLGNWMVCAAASNKKLLDRGIRLVAEMTGLDYAAACDVYFDSLDVIEKHYSACDEYLPPAAFTIYRIYKQAEGSFSPGDPLPRVADILEELAVKQRSVS